MGSMIACQGTVLQVEFRFRAGNKIAEDVRQEQAAARYPSFIAAAKLPLLR